MYIFMNHPVSIVPAVPLGEVYDRPESLSAGCKNGHMFCYKMMGFAKST